MKRLCILFSARAAGGGCGAVWGAILGVTLFVSGAQAQGDAELAEMRADFERAVAERIAELNAHYVERLEELERGYVEAGDYASAAQVVAELETIVGASPGGEVVDVRPPPGGVIELAVGEATLKGVEHRDGLLGNWRSDGEAVWRFAPVPQGGYRVVVRGKSLVAGGLGIRVEEPFHFLDGERELAAGEELTWELGYLRLREAADALRCQLFDNECQFQIESIQLFSPDLP